MASTKVLPRPSELVEKVSEKEKELQLNIQKVKILQSEGGARVLGRRVSLCRRACS